MMKRRDLKASRSRPYNRTIPHLPSTPLRARLRFADAPDLIMLASQTLRDISTLLEHIIRCAQIPLSFVILVCIVEGIQIGVIALAWVTILQTQNIAMQLQLMRPTIQNDFSASVKFMTAVIPRGHPLETVNVVEAMCADFCELTLCQRN
jgi:hypothetical protein